MGRGRSRSVGLEDVCGRCVCVCVLGKDLINGLLWSVYVLCVCVQCVCDM